MEIDEPVFFHVMDHARSVDRDVITMVSGSPDWEPPAALRDGLASYADGDPDTFQYPPAEGLPRLRERIAASHGVSADQVVITNGAGEANYLAMAVALDRFSGSEILLTDPGYPYYRRRTRMLNGSPRFVQTGHDGAIDPADVRETVSAETAAVLINSPNNPTGAVYTQDTISRLAEIAQRADAALISDEVYDTFDYSGRFASALSQRDRCSGVIVTNSFSKKMAVTGFRVGYTILPESLVDDVVTRHMLVNVACSRPAQAAVEHAMAQTADRYYQQSRDRMAERVETFVSILTDAGISCHRPDGGFYVTVDPDGVDGSLEQTKQLISQAGVAGMPGAAFGEQSADWLRFALTTERVDTAAHRLVDALRQY